MLSIPNAPIEDWLSALKPYQRAHIEALLVGDRTPEQAVDIWLSARGGETTIVFGGARESQPFLDRFKDEFKKFVCGDLAYEEDRSKLLTKADAAKTTIVSAVSSAVALNIGTSAALLVPAVTLMLHVVGKLGIRAWCSGASPTDQASG